MACVSCRESKIKVSQRWLQDDLTDLTISATVPNQRAPTALLEIVNVVIKLLIKESKSENGSSSQGLIKALDYLCASRSSCSQVESANCVAL